MGQVVLNNLKQKERFLGIIRETVSKVTGVPEETIDKKTRKREVVQARQLCMHFAKITTNCSLATIGVRFGGKDHATVLHANKTVENLHDTDRVFRGMYSEIYMKLTELIPTIEENILVCERCRGNNIQTRVWTDPNTDQIKERNNCAEDKWCEDCQEHVSFYTNRYLDEMIDQAIVQAEIRRLAKMTFEEKFAEATKNF